MVDGDLLVKRRSVERIVDLINSDDSGRVYDVFSALRFSDDAVLKGDLFVYSDSNGVKHYFASLDDFIKHYTTARLRAILGLKSGGMRIFHVNHERLTLSEYRSVRRYMALRQLPYHFTSHFREAVYTLSKLGFNVEPALLLLADYLLSKSPVDS